MARPKTSPHDTQRFLDVLVVGEALVDVVTTPDGQVEHPGGSPANVAYGLGLLGVATGLLTAIAPDARGTLIEEHLRQAGVTLLPDQSFSRARQRPQQSLGLTAPRSTASTSTGNCHQQRRPTSRESSTRVP